MKEYKKYIFDLDYTLLIPDWSKEDDYLKKYIPLEEQEQFFKQKQDILNKYELEFPKYDFKTLSNYFKTYGLNVSEEIIKNWMIHNGETKQYICSLFLFQFFLQLPGFFHFFSLNCLILHKPIKQQPFLLQLFHFIFSKRR